VRDLRVELRLRPASSRPAASFFSLSTSPSNKIEFFFFTHENLKKFLFPAKKVMTGDSRSEGEKIPDPDPHVFGPPESGSISQKYGSGSCSGSGSFYH
jgi:hypothetical protein